MKLLLIVFLIPFALKADIDTSIQAGVKYLLEHQAPDGSFGSPGRTKDLNIYAPGPGAHDVFKSATSALCLMALAQVEDESPEVQKGIKRCTAYLLKIHPAVRRVDGRWVGNVWSHTYIIKAMLRVRGKSYLAELNQEIEKCLKHQIKQLERFQYLDGGWGYYDFKHHTDKPSGSSTSFLTASVLIALKEAQENKFAVNKETVRKGLFQLNRQRRPDGCFLYASDFHFYKGRRINKPQGSVGRNQGCFKALYEWDSVSVKKADMEKWVGKLIELNGWLDMGRKRPVPHEAWYGVAGYFYYYGHYYAAENLKYCMKDKKKLAGQLAGLITDRQEKNGSWFDYPLYDYGHFYGTAYALMTLQKCSKALN